MKREGVTGPRGSNAITVAHRTVPSLILLVFLLSLALPRQLNAHGREDSRSGALLSTKQRQRIQGSSRSQLSAIGAQHVGSEATDQSQTSAETADGAIREVIPDKDGTPVEISEDREYRGEANALRYLLDLIRKESLRRSLFNEIRQAINLYANGFNERFIQAAHEL
ncbi:MAG TPA: hypothetical protein VGL29_14510 [Blastocatellia bacterium]